MQRLYRNYFQTYVERDVRQILQVKDLSLFEQFIRLLAGRTGQVLNLHSLGNEIGHLFENLVVIEALKTRMNQGLDANLYFFRDNLKSTRKNGFERFFSRTS